MPTPVFLTGFEHGVVVTGATPTPNDRIWHTVTTTGGAPTIESTGALKHGRVLRCPGAAARSDVGRNIAGAPAVAVASFYILFEGSLPSADCRLFALVPAAGSFCFLKFLASDSTLRASFGTADGATGFVVAPDTWYLVDIRVDASTGTRTIDVSVNGEAIGTASSGIAASTFATFRLGSNVDTTTATAPVRYDDFVLSTAIVADYPMGEHEVLAMRLNADGTHSFTANDFIYGDAGAAVALTATDVWSMLDEVPFAAIDTTDAIQQNVIRTTGYVEVKFGGLPRLGIAWGVQVLAQFDADATGADTSGMRLFDGTTEDTLYAPPNGDVSNTTETFLTFTRALDPTGRAWTPEALRRLRVRWGFSGDVTGSPIIHALMAEVAFPSETQAGGGTMVPLVQRGPFVRYKLGRPAPGRAPAFEAPPAFIEAASTAFTWSISSAAASVIRGALARGATWSLASAPAGVIRAAAAAGTSWSTAAASAGILRMVAASGASWSVGSALENTFKGLSASGASWSLADAVLAGIRGLRTSGASWSLAASAAGAIRPRLATGTSWSMANARLARLVAVQSVGATWSLGATTGAARRGCLATAGSWTIGDAQLSANRAIRSVGATWALSVGNGSILSVATFAGRGISWSLATAVFGGSAGRPPYGVSIGPAPDATVGDPLDALVTSGGDARLT